MTRTIEEIPEDRVTRRVLNAIVTERRRQDAKWGEQNHAPEVWLAILTEEVGEAAQAILALRFGAKNHGGEKGSTLIECYRSELVQVAAVAVAAIESLDRAKP